MKSHGRKEAAGTLRADRQPKRDFVARLMKPPRPPARLSERAAAEWRGLSRSLVEIGMLTLADLRALELLAETLATESEAREILAREGITLPTGDGGAKAHPALKAMEAARAQATRLLSDFGLTPRGRQSVDTAPPQTTANRFNRNGAR